MATEDALASPVSRRGVTACAGTNEAAVDLAVHECGGGVVNQGGSRPLCSGAVLWYSRSHRSDANCYAFELWS